ncbi:transglutaminase domain-containing protein [Carboxylicivirga sp. M1479]|uniref:transglutaminase domain-containing protein n=1 Tax=Carboxylicivirga sp. M1479 TaxID=2594476 RepID=UPI0011785BAF|nr:transglutaminase domain-containing protein [Carboxylicivirga sp. M1479]TRX72034.1 hypothetical protein FNN09_03240 [Carboxylicivirga sp. M1479]
MKKLSFLFGLTILAFVATAQIEQSIIDKIRTYPVAYDHYESLAQQIQNDFDTEESRAAAIFTWIALNIQYDTDSYFSSHPKTISYSYRTEEERKRIERSIHEMLAEATIQDGKGVCQGYSELFRVLCLECGIESKIVSGYSKTKPEEIGQKLGYADHAWNAVKLGGVWYLLDVTWAAGYVHPRFQEFVPKFNPVYYKTKPELFFLNHYPNDTKWILNRYRESQFVNIPLVTSAYLSKGMKINSPKKGIISKVKGGIIKIEIITDELLNTFSYRFNDQIYMEEVNGERVDEKLVLTIPVEDRKSGYLHIIADFETLVTYKLQLR